MSRIEQLISDMEAYIDSCKYVRFSSNKIAVDKDQLEDMLAELKDLEHLRRLRSINEF